MKRINLLFGALMLLLICACEKDEIAIDPHQAGDAEEYQVAMEQDYRNQLFFDLETGEVVCSNLKTEWDLGFECASEGFHVVMNTSKGMAVHHSSMGFSEIVSATGLDWTWDAHSGNLDSTAIGNWTTNNERYIIDRGYDHTGTHQGYYKINLVSVNEAEYKVEYGEITTTEPLTIIIPKSQKHNFRYFSFEDGVGAIAPEKDKWDLVFTQYTHLFTDPISPYVVSGVLLNRYKTFAGVINDIPFTSVTFEDAEQLNLSTAINTVGYDWKWYDYDEGVYKVDPTIVYIIQTSEGYYYKLHFVDFYNETGEKGFPKFECQRL
ncbi:MAG: HmuY family protein [Crocinitomicaceae bacterium]|nr:HmuY family protein [Crocinitomicaceae bacterium]